MASKFFSEFLTDIEFVCAHLNEKILHNMYINSIAPPFDSQLDEKLIVIESESWNR